MILISLLSPMELSHLWLFVVVAYLKSSHIGSTSMKLLRAGSLPLVQRV